MKTPPPPLPNVPAVIRCLVVNPALGSQVVVQIPNSPQNSGRCFGPVPVSMLHGATITSDWKPHPKKHDDGRLAGAF